MSDFANCVFNEFHIIHLGAKPHYNNNNKAKEFGSRDSRWILNHANMVYLRSFTQTMTYVKVESAYYIYNINIYKRKIYKRKGKSLPINYWYKVFHLYDTYISKLT